MKKNDVKTGGEYLAKVTDKLVTVRIDAENPHGGWDATNLETNRQVRIKTAQRLHGPAKKANGVKAAGPAADDAAQAPAKKHRGKAKQNAAPKEKKVSALDAAAQVLAAADEPMNAKQMIEAITEQGLWTSPGGKTPWATLYSAIIREIAVKGDEARFQKTERGKFAANA